MLTLRRAPAVVVEPPVLDATQRAAVAAAGPVVRVLSGPGTGSSTVAVEIVVDRVDRHGLTPDQCLVLAPTRLAAAGLRERITARLARTPPEPLARTHQAFGFAILRREAALRGAPTPRLLSGPEQDVVLRDLLAGHAASGVGPQWPDRVLAALGTRGFRAELPGDPVPPVVTEHPAQLPQKPAPTGPRRTKIGDPHLHVVQPTAPVCRPPTTHTPAIRLPTLGLPTRRAHRLRRPPRPAQVDAVVTTRHTGTVGQPTDKGRPFDAVVLQRQFLVSHRRAPARAQHPPPRHVRAVAAHHLPHLTRPARPDEAGQVAIGRHLTGRNGARQGEHRFGVLRKAHRALCVARVARAALTSRAARHQ